jgi:hypothetical protein
MIKSISRQTYLVITLLGFTCLSGCQRTNVSNVQTNTAQINPSPKDICTRSIPAQCRDAQGRAYQNPRLTTENGQPQWESLSFDSNGRAIWVKNTQQNLPFE